MAKIFGQLERAQAENVSSDTTPGLKGRLIFNTVSGLLKFDDGTSIQSLTYSGSIVDADISASALIARSKLAVGTASQVIINDGSGILSSEAALAKVRGGSGADNTNLTFPSTGTLATLAGVEVLTNKDINGGTASNTSRLTLGNASLSVINSLTPKAGTLFWSTDNAGDLYVGNGSNFQQLAKHLASTYTPTITTGSGTAASVTINSANYVVIGKICYLALDIQWTQATATTTSFRISLPVTADGSLAWSNSGGIVSLVNISSSATNYLYLSGTTTQMLLDFANKQSGSSTNITAGQIVTLRASFVFLTA